MSNRHKVFVSYHHALDESYKNIFELRFGNRFGAIIPGSVKVGDIDPSLATETIRQKIRDEYLRDTSVTVVLIGAETWQRKHIDWEIGSSIRQTEYNCEHFASDSIVSSREARGSAGECGVERARSGGARDGCRWRYGEFAGGGRAVGPRQQRS